MYLAGVQGNTSDQMGVIEELTNEMISPATQANIVQATYISPMNQNTQVPSNIASLIGYSPANVGKMVQINWLDYAKNSSQFQTLWDQNITPLIG